MGRTNGKLIPFLRDGLLLGVYENLNYDDDDPHTFDIELPRYERGKSMHKYEQILKEWYKCNGKKYDNYSTAKAVFQASLKKSVHLMSEPTSVKKLRFRFANEAEIQENKRKIKEKEKNSKHSVELDSSDELLGSFEAATAASNIDSWLPIFDQFASNPLSVQSSSSGYSTGEEAEERKSPVDLDSLLDLDFILDGNAKNEGLDLGNIKVEDLFKPVHELTSLSGPVQEMNFTPVDTSRYVKKKTYWLCNKKLNLDSILQLICEKQILEEGNLIEEGTIVIPNEVWEPGISYDLQKSFELNQKLFLLLSPRV